MPPGDPVLHRYRALLAITRELRDAIANGDLQRGQELAQARGTAIAELTAAARDGNERPSPPAADNRTLRELREELERADSDLLSTAGGRLQELREALRLLAAERRAIEAYRPAAPQPRVLDEER